MLPVVTQTHTPGNILNFNERTNYVCKECKITCRKGGEGERTGGGLEGRCRLFSDVADEKKSAPLA